MGVQVFGRYELVRLAGAGGMAQVHLARQVGPEGFVKPCVLKRIAPDHARTEAVRHMFLEEARLSALLNHPNIVQTFDFGEVDGTPYLAMELVDGVNLAQLCRTLAQQDRWLPLQPAVEIAAAVLEALDYAHNLRALDGRALQLVHRDVSPQNTLLSRQGTVKLSDFGIARHEARDIRTVGLQAKGKPGYMAPEQAMSGAVDARADIFSVGVMLAELISARRVLTSKNRVNQVLDIDNRVRTLCGLRQEAPPELIEFVAHMCALEPDRRPGSAREAATLLRKASSRIPPSVPLQEFLRSVFGLYLAPEANHEPVEPTALDLPPQASASASDLRFERRAWDSSEVEPTATEAVYAQGWPSRYLEGRAGAPPLSPPASLPPDPTSPGAPDGIALVPNSSSVDAMQYFQAQMSEEAAARSETSPEEIQAAEAARAQQHRLPYTPGGRAPAPTDPGTQTGLPQPVFSDSSAAPGTKKGPLRFEDPKLEKALANISEDGVPVEATGTPGKTRRGVPPVVILLGLGLLVAGVGVGVLALFSSPNHPEVVAAPSLGTVEVSSDPPGGRIFLDGRDTGKTTPTVLKGLPVDEPMRLSVRRDGHLSVPPDVTVRIPQVNLRTTARFTLQPGRAYRIVSEPSEASVTVNGHRLGQLTPVTLQVVPFGTSATITLALDGHLPKKLVLESRTETPTVAKMMLEPGRSIEISSNPPGAQVFLDGEKIGQTPIYDVLVPLERRFSLQMRHRGFQRWRKRFVGKRLDTEQVVADLEPLQFLALPWSREEKREARDVDRKRTQVARKLARLEAALKKAQALQAKVESSINASVGDLAEVQRKTDLTREAVAEAEAELSEIDAQMQGMREQLLLRMEAE